MAKNFAQKDENIVFSWMKDAAFGITGYGSTLMKIALIVCGLVAIFSIGYAISGKK